MASSLGLANQMPDGIRMLMEEQPDLVLAYPGGTGTANMLELARAAGARARVLS